MGDSAIIVPITLPEELARLRDANDAMAPRGVPAHVTVLFPFVAADELTTEVLDDLRGLAAERRAFDAQFGHVERRGGMVWLVPTDQRPFLQLTAAVQARWPDHAPYGGVHRHLVAHLTLVEAADADTLDRVESAARTRGLVEHAVNELVLIEEDAAGDWRRREAFPLRA